ncbi:acyl-CoA dehydrogenase [Pseudorhodoplanes sp.]|uniref:acyl-CoA dehydrogenase n=1 Tax=Pseudorhodoplanes sp. TaxID=1934341 RepID=UPI003D1166DC
MLSYEPPVKEYMFLRDYVLPFHEVGDLPGFEALESDFMRAVIGEAGRVAADIYLPLNAVGDKAGCVRNEDGSVRTPPGYAEAYRKTVEAGWSGISAPEVYGGQNLPKSVSSAVVEFMGSANIALDMYIGWGDSISTILCAVGTEDQRRKFLPPLIRGDWTAAMAMTEPHCGTDVGLIRTRAERAEDGSYRLYGTKIFISGGEHDLTSNILHFVLARVKGAPSGTGGLSLFAVPKFPIEGERTDSKATAKTGGFHCGAVEHKMGLNGSATCEIQYDGARGELVGEEGRGLAGMFMLVNHIRRKVGILSVGISELAYQNAARYACERRQGRASGARESKESADLLIMHPDVKRVLFSIRSFSESARALVLWTGLLIDVIERCPDEQRRKQASKDLALLVPVVKAFLSDIALENVISAQQLFGGHGYMAETGMEQLVRDIRMLLIVEGANGIHGLDLVQRKIGPDGGVAIMAMIGRMRQDLQDLTDARGGAFRDQLANALDEWESATQFIASLVREHPTAAAEKANDYLHLAGTVLLGCMWAWIGKVLRQAEADGQMTQKEVDTKWRLMDFYRVTMLPKVQMLRKRIEGPAVLEALNSDVFTY